MLNLNDYPTALHIQREGADILVPLEISEDGTILRVGVVTFWTEPPIEIECEISVPSVEPVRFAWDNGIHGYIIHHKGGARRFCHPLLHSDIADKLAAVGSEAALEAALRLESEDWGFVWLNWYDRVQLAVIDALEQLSKSRRRPNWQLIGGFLQRAINQLVNGSAKGSGLPLTDDPATGPEERQGKDWSKLARQMYEVELGFPEAHGNGLLSQKLKLAFIRYVDNGANVLFTGKHKVGQYVMRTPPDGPKSLITGTGVPQFMLAINPFSGHANPTRVFREGRSLPDAQVFVEPIRPPLATKGVALPDYLAQRITTLVVAFADLKGANVHSADAEAAREFGLTVGEEMCLDGFLVCPSGQHRLLACQAYKELWDAEKFLPRLPELQEYPGFWMREVPEGIDRLADGTEVLRYKYRHGYDKPLWSGYDKVKLLYGGMKAVTRPWRQYWTDFGQGLVKIDMFGSEACLLGKGGRDAGWGIGAHHAGLTEVDPTWTAPELQAEIETGLLSRGHRHWSMADPDTCRFPVLEELITYRDELGLEIPAALAQHIRDGGGKVHVERDYREVGRCLVGPLPVMRAQETEHRQANHTKGVSVDLHLRNIAGMEFPRCDEDRALATAVARFFYEQADLVQQPV